MKAVRRILVITLMITFFISCHQIRCHKYETIIQRNERILYTLDSLKSIVLDNEELYYNIATIIYKNDEIKKVIKEHNEEDWEIYTAYDQRFFSDSEWEMIQEFFDITGVYQIIRSLKYGNDIVYFIYYEDISGSTTLDLYYIFENGEQTIQNYKGRDDKITRINNWWWIIEKIHEKL